VVQRRPMNSTDVNLLGWDDRHAVARVKGVKARVGVTPCGVRWSCAEHGTAPEPHCIHTQALAETPADPERRHQP
jgi:hypothetical protein